LKIFQLFSIVFDSFEEKKSQNYGLFTVAAAAPTTATTGASHRGANHLFSRRTANLSIGELETDSDEAVPTASRLPPVLPKAPKSKREG
jgi:hypothetical protein